MSRPRKPWPPALSAGHHLVPWKACTECGNEWPIHQAFYARRTKSKDGHAWRCKGCSRKANRQAQARRCADPTPSLRLQQLRGGAMARNLDWKLTVGDIRSHWDAPCHYCGCAIDGVGLDRVDNTKGYTRTNVVPCCPTCNRMKGTMSAEDFIRQCRSIAGGAA